jgi:septal ring factor EnvC (AmiA/AmiB activator)
MGRRSTAAEENINQRRWKMIKLSCKGGIPSFTGLLCLVLTLACLTSCKSKNSSVLNLERIEESRAAILEHISDQERRQEMLAMVDPFENDVREVVQEIKELRQQIIAANQGYDTTRSDLEAIYAQITVKLEELNGRVQADSMKMRTLCSQAEWKKIFGRNDKLINFYF